MDRTPFVAPSPNRPTRRRTPKERRQPPETRTASCRGLTPHHANGNPLSDFAHLEPAIDSCSAGSRGSHLLRPRAPPLSAHHGKGVPVRRLGFGLAGTVGMLVAVIFVSAASAAVPTVACANRVNNTHAKLQGCVTLAGAREHQLALRRESRTTTTTRLVGHTWLRRWVDYAQGVLEAAGYLVTRQEFDFPYTEENSELVRISPLPRTFVNGVDFLRNRFDTGTPEGTATGTLVPVDLVINPSLPPNSNSSGCEATRLRRFPGRRRCAPSAGNVRLQREGHERPGCRCLRGNRHE